MIRAFPCTATYLPLGRLVLLSRLIEGSADLRSLRPHQGRFKTLIKLVSAEPVAPLSLANFWVCNDCKMRLGSTQFPNLLSAASVGAQSWKSRNPQWQHNLSHHVEKNRFSLFTMAAEVRRGSSMEVFGSVACVPCRTHTSLQHPVCPRSFLTRTSHPVLLAYLPYFSMCSMWKSQDFWSHAFRDVKPVRSENKLFLHVNFITVSPISLSIHALRRHTFVLWRCCLCDCA